MKKMTLKMRLLSGLVIVSMALAAGSCAQGADCDEVFSAGVTNTQLESPELDNSCFTPFDTEEGLKLQVSWPVVYGAGGYEVKVANVTEPESYLVDTLLDGCTMMVPVMENETYAVSVRSAGNKKYNNTAAETASEYNFTVAGTRLLIPSPCEISTYITEHYQAPAAPSLGLIYELEAGGQYTLEHTADFNLDKVKIVGNAENRPTITVSGDGNLMTQAGLQLLDINFDCADRTKEGVITFHTKPDQSIYVDNLDEFKSGVNRKTYIVADPIIISNCWFKDVSNSFIYNNKKSYGIFDLRILNSIVQFNYAGSNNMFIPFQSGNYSTICYMTIENSTLFNVANTSAYWMRFQSRVNPEKAFGDAQKNKALWLFKNSTIYDTQMSSRDFANNPPRTGTQLMQYSNNIIQNLKNIHQLGNGCTTTWENNTVCVTDDGKNKDADVAAGTLTAPEDPAFVGPIQSLNFELPNGGVNFTPTGANTLAGRRGDPRWLN